MNKKRSQHGFTLLEMMVASTVMAIAVVGLLAALSTSLRNASRVADHDRAALLAKRKMEELLLQPRMPRFTPVEGKLQALDNAGFEGGWIARKTPFEMPPNPTPGAAILERIECEVWWMEGGKRKSYRLDGYRTAFLRTEDIMGGMLR